MATEDSSTETNVARRRPLLDIALVIALTPLVAAAIRVWMYSGGDTSLFLVLLQTLDIPAALIASSVLLVPVVVILAVVVLQTDWRARDFAKETLDRNPWVAPIFPITFFVLIYTGNIYFAIGAGFVLLTTGAYLLIKRFWKWGHKHINQVLVAPRGDKNGPASVLTVIGVLTIFMVTPTNMWLPLERIERVEGEPLTAYVLKSESDWTTLLTPQRQIEILRTSEVEERAVCRPSGPITLATLLYQSNLADAPDCDLAED